MTDSDDHGALGAVQAAVLEAERDGVRVALAAARGTILDLRSHIAELRAAQDFMRLSCQAAQTEAHQLRQSAGAAEAELQGREAAWRMERARLLQECDSRTAAQVGTLTAERDASTRRAQALDRLVQELRWESGPRSVRAVLPLARLMRRMAGG